MEEVHLMQERDPAAKALVFSQVQPLSTARIKLQLALCTRVDTAAPNRLTYWSSRPNLFLVGSVVHFRALPWACRHCRGTYAYAALNCFLGSTPWSLPCAVLDRAIMGTRQRHLWR